jgi:hypothetical protein
MSAAHQRVPALHTAHPGCDRALSSQAAPSASGHRLCGGRFFCIRIGGSWRQRCCWCCCWCCGYSAAGSGVGSPAVRWYGHSLCRRSGGPTRAGSGSGAGSVDGWANGRCLGRCGRCRAGNGIKGGTGVRGRHQESIRVQPPHRPWPGHDRRGSVAMRGQGHASVHRRIHWPLEAERGAQTLQHE